MHTDKGRRRAIGKAVRAAARDARLSRGKYLIIRTDPETHHALKLRALEEGTSVQRLVAGAVARLLARPARGGRP